MLIFCHKNYQIDKNTTNFKNKLEHCLIYKAIYSLEQKGIVLFSKYQRKWVNEFAEEHDFTTLHYSNIFKTYVKQIMRLKKKRIGKIILDEKRFKIPKN